MQTFFLDWFPQIQRRKHGKVVFAAFVCGLFWMLGLPLVTEVKTIEASTEKNSLSAGLQLKVLLLKVFLKLNTQLFFLFLLVVSEALFHAQLITRVADLPHQ